MKLVSTRNVLDIEATRDAKTLANSARNIAANILRIIAGAGNEFEIYRQTRELLESYDKFKPHAGVNFPFHHSTPVVDGLTDLDWRKDDPAYSKPTEEDRERWSRDGTTEREMAIDSICQYSLRLVAAQLLAQPTQESKSKSDLLRAIRDFEGAQQKYTRRTAPRKREYDYP